jgi:hypothetical protein
VPHKTPTTTLDMSTGQRDRKCRCRSVGPNWASMNSPGWQAERRLGDHQDRRPDPGHHQENRYTGPETRLGQCSIFLVRQQPAQDRENSAQRQKVRTTMYGLTQPVRHGHAGRAVAMRVVRILKVRLVPVKAPPAY